VTLRHPPGVWELCCCTSPEEAAAPASCASAKDEPARKPNAIEQTAKRKGIMEWFLILNSFNILLDAVRYATVSPFAADP